MHFANNQVIAEIAWTKKTKVLKSVQKKDEKKNCNSRENDLIPKDKLNKV